MKVHLQIGVATVFTPITVSLLRIVVAPLYHSNRELALQRAHQRMQEARSRSVEDLLEVISRTGRAVEVAANMASSFTGDVSVREVGGLALARTRHST